MYFPRILLTLFCISISFAVFSQTDSIVKKRPVKTANSTKLELVFRTAEYTSYNMSTGQSRMHFVAYPNISINGRRPVDIDRHANILRPYYVKAPLSMEQLGLMDQQMRRGKIQTWSLIGGGVVTAFSGLFAAAKEDAKESVFWTRFAIGGTMMMGGGFLSYYHAKKAEKHLRLSVDIYNSRYYKPVAKDTSIPATTTTPTATTEVTTVPSERKYYQDKVLYELIRNDPRNSNLWGVYLDFVSLDLNSTNLSVGATLGIVYTYKSLLGVNLSFRKAYLDDASGEHKQNPPRFGWEEGHGIPSNYARAYKTELQTKWTIASFDRDIHYGLTLGRNKMGTAEGTVKGEAIKALTARLGYQIDNRILESDNGIPFKTTTAPYDYGGGYMLDARGGLSHSSAMIRTNVIAAGIGWSGYKDIKIALKDETYKGRREVKVQTDLYFDVLYAHTVKLQDMVFYHVTPERDIHFPQRLDISSTPVKKVGARLGYQQMGMASHAGIKIGIEVGTNPGVKMEAIDDALYLKISTGFILGGRVENKKQ